MPIPSKLILVASRVMLALSSITSQPQFLNCNTTSPNTHTKHALHHPICTASTVNREYWYLNLLGHGSSSSVVKAIVTPLHFRSPFCSTNVGTLTPNRSVAIKIYDRRSERESREEYIDGIKREYEVMREMASHPNIVQTLGLLEEDGRWKLVMEHCEESLVGKLNKGMMSEDEVMGVWTVIVNATRRMHNLGLAHRDLKAQNVLFCDGVPKLGDFGSALRFRDERTGELIWADGVEGTEPYLAPEVWAGRYNASKADVWQLGVLLMAMWTRNLPWKTAKMADQKFNNFMENHEELFLDVPVVFHSVLRRTLTVYPEQRAGLEEIEKILVGLKA